MRFVDSPQYGHVQVVLEGIAFDHWGYPKDVHVGSVVTSNFFSIGTDTDHVLIDAAHLDELIDGLQRLKHERDTRQRATDSTGGTA